MKKIAKSISEFFPKYVSSLISFLSNDNYETDEYLIMNNMGKKIILSEEKFNEIVSNTLDELRYRSSNNEGIDINEVISYQLFKKGIINEMAFKKKDFIRHIASLRIQLLENWCLCAYCCMYDKMNDNFHRWETEFIAHADNIKASKLKDGDKFKIISQTYLDNFDLNDPSMIHQIIRGKFKRECIEDSCADAISQICAKETIGLIKFLSNDNYSSDEYVARTFEC